MTVPDPAPVGAFLGSGHPDLAARAGDFARARLRDVPEPSDDGGARRRARELLGELAGAGLYAPIGETDLRGCCLVREALGWADPLADAVFALQALGTTPLLLAGSPEQRERWVGPLLSGEAMGGFAMTEPEAGSDVAALRTRAARDGEGWVLDGEKHLISNAGIADVYVVFASTDPGAGSRGISAFVVPADADGLVFDRPQVMSAPHPLGALRFEGCRVPPDGLLGEEGRGFALGMATLDRIRPTVGAAACGMAARALEEALDHAARRRQFGRPLAELQLVQEKLGRMATVLDAARLLVYRAADAKDGGAERITREAAMAKAFATEAAQEVVDEAVQILGGRGVLAESPVDRLYRSVRALRIYEGATDIQRLIVAGSLLRERAEGGGRDGAAPTEGRERRT